MVRLLVNIDVDNLEKAIEFYGGGLGLVLKRRLFDGTVAEMVGATALVYLLEKVPGSQASAMASIRRDYRRHWTPVHLDVSVDNLATAVQRALDAGAVVEGDPRAADRMAEPISLRFESTLPASREQVWEWITSVKGISAEMWPVLRMTVPRGIRSLADVPLTAGAPLFRSYVFLFGVLPFDYSDLTLLEITAGDGFVEQSPMGSMKLWRHERRIVPSPTDRSAVVLVDQLRFEPRFASSLVRWFIRRFFEHRHRVVRAHFGADARPAF